MPVRKQCVSKGCKSSPRCDHPWWLDVTHNGKRYRMPVDDFAAARGGTIPIVSKEECKKVWEPRFRDEICKGRDPRQPDVPQPSLTVAKFIEDYTKRHCEAQQLNMDSLQQRLNRISARFGDLPLTDMEDPNLIEDFKAELVASGIENSTVNRYLAQLRHMTNWAIGRALLTRSPFYNRHRNASGVKLLKGENQRTRRLYEGEEQALLAAADQLFEKHRVLEPATPQVMRARIEIAIDLGLRRGEMLKIQNRDIDWRATPDPILTIRPANAKSRRQRRIAVVSPRVRAWLDSRRAVGGADGHPYGDSKGGLVDRFEHEWKAVLQLAGIIDKAAKIDGDLHWHDLRRECGSRLAERGVDIMKVKELLGHATITMTQRYFATTTEAVGEAMRNAMGWKRETA
jgi:integrase